MQEIIFPVWGFFSLIKAGFDYGQGGDTGADSGFKKIKINSVTLHNKPNLYSLSLKNKCDCLA